MANPFIDCYQRIALAAKAGDLAKVQRLHRLEPRWDERVCDNAASSGHITVLKWVRSQDPPCPWSAWTCVFAARHGQLEALKWARANGCEWNYRTAAMAAREGHSEMLKWCLETGCEISAEAWRNAASGGHIEALEILRGATSGPFAWDESACGSALACGQLAAAKWLFENGAPYDLKALNGFKDPQVSEFHAKYGAEWGRRTLGAERYEEAVRAKKELDSQAKRAVDRLMGRSPD